MQTVRGFRGKLEQHLDPMQEILVETGISGSGVYDWTCFGVDAAGKLSDDRYMVFYNQLRSPGGEILCSVRENAASFRIQLSRLPQTIQKLVFTVSIDGPGTMGNISSCSLKIRQRGKEEICLSLTGSDFRAERAIITVELYRKDVWRFSAVCSGFNGGLPDLLRHFGGEEASGSQETQGGQGGQGGQGSQETQPAAAGAAVRKEPQTDVLGGTQPGASYHWSPGERTVDEEEIVADQWSLPAEDGRQNGETWAASSPAFGATVESAAPKKISLKKKLEAGAPQLATLAGPIETEVSRHHLQDCVARVGLALDISGSMSQRYRNGTVQDVVNRTLPLAVLMDDDGKLDCWYYGTTSKQMRPITMKNYQSAVPANWRDLMKEVGGRNNEPEVMRKIIKKYKKGPLPAYVLFITDGGVSSTGQIKELLRESSHYPIFWQFVGIGGSNYGILRQLDTLDGRYVDNANFFALDDFLDVSNEELYSRLLGEFPLWLQAVRKLGMIP